MIASDINIAALSNIPGITAVSLDVTDTLAINNVAQAIGPVDVLFNCAGVVHSGDILTCSEQEWQFALDLNVTAMFHMIRAFLPGMIACQQGSIINMSSVASSIKGVPNRFAYSTSKAAVIGLTRSVAADYVTQGIRCNAICPEQLNLLLCVSGLPYRHTPKGAAKLMSFRHSLHVNRLAVSAKQKR